MEAVGASWPAPARRGEAPPGRCRYRSGRNLQGYLQFGRGCPRFAARAPTVLTTVSPGSMSSAARRDLSVGEPGARVEQRLLERRVARGWMRVATAPVVEVGPAHPGRGVRADRQPDLGLSPQFEVVRGAWPSHLG